VSPTVACADQQDLGAGAGKRNRLASSDPARLRPVDAAHDPREDGRVLLVQASACGAQWHAPMVSRGGLAVIGSSPHSAAVNYVPVGRLPAEAGDRAPRHSLLMPDPRERPVSDLMTPGCLTISDAATVADAAAAVDRHGVRSVLVVDAGTGRPLGWATAQGLVEAATAAGREAGALAAVCEEIVALPPSETTAGALDAMQRTGARRMLVRRRPNIAPDGVLSELDLAPALSR
jgi:CBS domain-containing protein